MKIKPISFENSVNIFSGSFNTRRKVLNDTHLKLWRANRPGNKFQKCLYKTKTVNPEMKFQDEMQTGNISRIWETNSEMLEMKVQNQTRDVDIHETYTVRKTMASLWKWSLLVATLQMKYKIIMIAQRQMFYGLQWRRRDW